MNIPILIIILFSQCCLFGQNSTNISGTVVDENGNKLENAVIYFNGDTSHTNFQGYFKVAYPNPQRFFYSLHFEKPGFFPKTVFFDTTSNDIILENSIAIRSRKGFWYDKNKINKSHLGITVHEAISRYKLDIDECIVIDERPGFWEGFKSELADSSIIFFSIKGFFGTDRLRMKDILNYKITGIGIADMTGKEISFGAASAPRNLYFQEQFIRNEKLKGKQ